MRVVTKRLRLESRGFRYKVALYLSYLHIKLDDEISRGLFDDGTERHVADADQRNILEQPPGGGYCARIIFLLIIFSLLMTQRVV